jgi:hypothetical protein
MSEVTNATEKNSCAQESKDEYAPICSFLLKSIGFMRV